MLARVSVGSLATLVLLHLPSCVGGPPSTDPVEPPRTPVIVTVVVDPGTPPTATIGSINGPADVTPNNPAVPITSTTSTTTTVLSPAERVFPAPAWANWPQWRLTAEGVPYYKGRPACTRSQAVEIAGVFLGRGASVATAQWAVYVASREGGCNYLAVHIGRTDDSHCTFQLNAKAIVTKSGTIYGPLHPRGLLGKLGWTPTMVKVSLTECTRAAVDLWAACGKGPWIQGDYSCRRPQS